jgi:hypothetical protein
VQNSNHLVWHEGIVETEIAMTATIPAEIKKAVTFIFPADAQGKLLHDSKTGKPIPCGTGFFVGVKNGTGRGMYDYSVTAKHVLKDHHVPILRWLS